MEGDSLKFDFGCGVAKSKVSDCSEAKWKDMAEVTFYKFWPFDGFNFDCVLIGTVFPAEADVGVGDG